MKSWYEIYRDRMNAVYRAHIRSKYGRHIEAINETSPQSTIEIGCGAGNITRASREAIGGTDNCILIDSCPQMLGLAAENNPLPTCQFICADVRNVAMPLASVVHSHGLLEHFRDEDIQHIVKKCSRSAPLQYHYVPSSLYDYPSRGDERLLSPQVWKRILKNFPVEVIVFNGGLDLILKIDTRERK